MCQIPKNSTRVSDNPSALHRVLFRRKERKGETERLVLKDRFLALGYRFAKQFGRRARVGLCVIQTGKIVAISKTTKVKTKR